MPDHFQTIYNHHADRYDQLVSREDYQSNILPALCRLRPLDGLRVAEFGAGTGRLTRLLAPHVARVHAFDASPHMLEQATIRLKRMRRDNWSVAVADNRAIPLPGGLADIAIEGWSFGHLVRWYPGTWRDELDSAIAEMKRVLSPGGTTIIIETLGTGRETPQPPHEGLAACYAHLENHHGFSTTWIRTDYRFESPTEAESLVRFFFGDDLADQIAARQQAIVPECTGIWWHEA